MDKVKKHWRYLIARWGAYPVVWCLAGEGTMPYYLSKTPKEDADTQKHGLTELARYVHETDPHHHPVTIHPPSSARDCVDDASVIDFDMLQTGHSDRQSVPNTIQTINRCLSASPRMPVLIGEVCYEGIQEASRQEVQRFMFWSALLSGTGGHTYGANGIWQVNTREKPYGLSPHGHSWGGPPWDVAAALPGTRGRTVDRKVNLAAVRPENAGGSRPGHRQLAAIGGVGELPDVVRAELPSAPRRVHRGDGGG